MGSCILLEINWWPNRGDTEGGLFGSAPRQGWKKPGFFLKLSPVGFLGFFGFFGVFCPEERVLGFFQFQEYF
jgi:hypothetical protein